MIQLYRFFSPLLIALFGFAAKTVLSGKLRETWLIRWRPGGDARGDRYGDAAYRGIDRSQFKGSPIWIHAASGEFEYAKSAIRELMRNGETDIVVSYFSPTYAENIRRFPGVKASFPLPFDRIDWMLDLVDWLKPRCLLIARTDVWPCLILACEERKIPTLLFSATFHSGSRRMSFGARSLTAETLRRLTAIQCVANEDKNLLQRLGAAKVTVCGDSRYDQVLFRLENPKPIPTPLRSLRPMVMVAGSVWDEDIGPLLEATRDLDLTLVLVPHEPDEIHLQSIEDKVRADGQRRYARLSKLESNSMPEIDIAIVDQVGILAELYSLGSIAFVGGSFRSSVHSVMEPLAAGCITFIGPRHANNREALEFQNAFVRLPSGRQNPIVAAVDSDSFKPALRLLLEELRAASNTSMFRAAIQEQVRHRSGATSAILQWISELNS